MTIVDDIRKDCENALDHCRPYVRMDVSDVHKLLAVVETLKAEPRRGPTMSHRLMCDDTCGCPFCVTDNALAALEKGDV